MLELRALRCGHGGVEAVHGIDLTVPAGQITALIGPNGAGKSSTLMAIMGHVRTMGGDILFKGSSILQCKPAERTRRGLAIAPEGRRIFHDLSVRENLVVGGFLHSKAEALTREEEVLQLFPRLRERARQQAGSLSGGEQQMLAIGRALLSRPALMMLDEPSLGLSPLLVKALFNLITELNRDGLSILLVEQNTHMALATAHRAYVLELGRLVLEGDASTLATDPRMAEAYLGA